MSTPQDERLSEADGEKLKKNENVDKVTAKEQISSSSENDDVTEKAPKDTVASEQRSFHKEVLDRSDSWSTVMQAAGVEKGTPEEINEKSHSQDNVTENGEKNSSGHQEGDSQSHRLKSEDGRLLQSSAASPFHSPLIHPSSNYNDTSDISELGSRSSTPFPGSSDRISTSADKDRSAEDTQSEIQNIIEQFKDTSVSERQEKEARASELERARQSRRQSQFPNRTSSLNAIDTAQFRMNQTTEGSGDMSGVSSDPHGSDRSRRPTSPTVLAPPPAEPDLPFDFHRFLEQLRHRTADPVARFLRSFLNEFGKKQWLVHEQVKLVGDFLAFISGKMAQCEIWRGVSDVEFDNAREGMEKLVMNRLYTQTFSPCIPLPPNPPRSLSRSRRKEYERMRGPGRRGQHQEDVERDEVLAQKIRIYGWIREEHLDIPSLGSNGKRFLSLAQQELFKINAYRAPRDKVICILNCCKVIFGLLKHAKTTDTSADSFIPLLIYTVLKANPEHLVSNIQYIFRFRNQDKLTGEAGYYLSSLSGAVQFIENLDRTSLTIGDEEFEKNVEAAVSAIAEKDKERERSSLEAQERERERQEDRTRRANSQRQALNPEANSRNSSRPRRYSNNDNDHEESPVTGILRSIQKPLSTLGRIFTDESDSSAEPYSPPSSPLRPPPDPSRPLLARPPAGEQTSKTNQRQETDVQPRQLSGEELRARHASQQEIRRATSREESVIAAEARRIQRNEHRDVIETLSSMFPNLDKDVIDDVVKVKGGRVGPAVDACLALSAE